MSYLYQILSLSYIMKSQIAVKLWLYFIGARKRMELMQQIIKSREGKEMK